MPVQRVPAPFRDRRLADGARIGNAITVKSNPGEPESKSDSKPAPKDDKDALKFQPMPELMKKLETSANGLTQPEAKERLAQFGPNEIAEKKTNEFLKSSSISGVPSPG